MRWLLLVCLLIAGCQSRETRYQNALQERDRMQKAADKIRMEYTEALREMTLSVMDEIEKEIEKAESEEDADAIRSQEEDRLNAAHEPIHNEWKPKLEAQRERVREAEEYARSIKG